MLGCYIARCIGVSLSDLNQEKWDFVLFIDETIVKHLYLENVKMSTSRTSEILHIIPRIRLLENQLFGAI